MTYSVKLDTATLSHVPLFQGIPGPHLARFLEFIHTVTFNAGHNIVNEGSSASDVMYVLLRGEADVVKKGSAGREIFLETLHDGDFFGEMALFEREKRSATVRAKTHVEVLMLSRSSFERMVREDPDVAIEAMHVIVRRLSRRLRQTTEKLAGENYD